MSIAATSVSATSFTISGDLSAEIVAGMRVKADCGTDGTVTGAVTDSTYASGSGLTTVTLAMDSGGLTNNLTGVLHGNDAPDSMCVASTANRGGVILASGAETTAGTDTAKAVTPQGVAAAIEDRLPYASVWGYAYATSYATAATCTLSGARTGVFQVGVRVLADCGTDGTLYATVTESTYAEGTDATTLTLDLDSGSLTANLASLRPCNERTVSLIRATAERLGAVLLTADTGVALASGADISLGGYAVSLAKLVGWREGVQALGTLSADTTIDCAAGNVVTATIGASLTLSFSNVPASGVGGAVEFWLTNAGAYTVTWPTGVVWPDATAPTLTAAGVDIVVLKTIDNGTSWHGAAVTGYTA